MTRPRILMGLRIAVSATCGIACLLLVIMWVRSYWWCDNALSLLRHDLASLHGNVVIDETIRFTTIDGKIIYLGGDTADRFCTLSISLASVVHVPQGNGIVMPYWVLVVPLAVLTSAPWFGQIRWRYSLRTILIATTLVAVVLGLIVYAVR
jgi:hypothetical protein